MNVRKKLKNLLILLMLSTIFSITFLNSKTVSAACVMDPLLGQISLFAFPYAPMGWAECNGQELNISQNTALYSLIGIRFGGNGTTTFKLPNLQNSSPIPNAKYYIALEGIYPSFDVGSAEATIGEIVMFPYDRTPGGYLPCNGASLNIAQNQALYSLIGASYGGDGITSFNLPNLTDMEPIENMNYYICVKGYYPWGGVDEFLGGIDLLAFPYNRVEDNTYECNGQVLSISQNQALFSLMGINYGGDGMTNFKLPDLRGAVPLPQMNYVMPSSGLYPPRQ